MLHVVEGCEDDPRGQIDLGDDRDTRVQPCRKHTWCIGALDHAGWCIEIPRAQHPPPDFGPRRKK